MAEYVHLTGAEDVRAAGLDMSNAADQMRAAANHIDDALEHHRRFLDDWLIRLEAAIEGLGKKAGGAGHE